MACQAPKSAGQALICAAFPPESAPLDGLRGAHTHPHPGKARTPGAHRSIRLCLEHANARMFQVPDPDSAAVERFKEATRGKLRGLRCLDHHQPPRLHFSGKTLRDVTISMSGCCEKLMALANARIAVAPTDAARMKKPA